MREFFEPSSIAVVGASRDVSKPGRVILRNIANSFKGKIYPINPESDYLEGYKCYPSILDVPDKIDLVVISVRADIVPSILEQCGEKKVPAVIVISGGFKEIGRKDLEDEVKKIQKKYGFRLIGPNCLGVLDNYSGVDSTFLPKYKMHAPEPGKISLVSQSGAVASTTVDWASDQGLGISKMISYGNAADVDEGDLVEYLSKDNRTGVVLLYLEGVTNGRKFMEQVKLAVSNKPIVAVKAGRSKFGARAVASHTGSLAGSTEVYSAAFRQCGILVADSLEELLDFGKALDMQPVSSGPRVVVLTCGGGFGVMATDAIEKEGLGMAELSPDTVKFLKEQFPPYVVLNNPVDLTGDADAERYRVAIEALCRDPNVDIILLIILFQVPRLSSDVVEMMISAQRHKKPIIGVAAGSEFSKVHIDILEKGGIPVYPTPERGVKAIKALIEYGKIKKTFPGVR